MEEGGERKSSSLLCMEKSHGDIKEKLMLSTNWGVVLKYVHEHELLCL